MNTCDELKGRLGKAHEQKLAAIRAQQEREVKGQQKVFELEKKRIAEENVHKIEAAGREAAVLSKQEKMRQALLSEYPRPAHLKGQYEKAISIGVVSGSAVSIAAL